MLFSLFNCSISLEFLSQMCNAVILIFKLFKNLHIITTILLCDFDRICFRCCRSLSRAATSAGSTFGLVFVALLILKVATIVLIVFQFSVSMHVAHCGSHL